MTSSPRPTAQPPEPDTAVSHARAVLDQVTRSMAQRDHLAADDLPGRAAGLAAIAHPSPPRVLGRATHLQDDLYTMVSVASAVRINADAVPQSLRAFLACGVHRGGAPEGPGTFGST